MDKCKLLFTSVFHLLFILLEYSKGSASSQSDDNSQVSEFIKKYKNITDSDEKIDALRDFVRRKDAEKEIAINETIVAKEAEKVQAVNEMKTKMALGTFLCAMSFMEATVEYVYREEVEKCNPWKKVERPDKIKTDEILNERMEPHYQKWVGFMHQNSSKNVIGKIIRERIPKGQYLDFAWSMPKIYFFCKDYVHGRRSFALKRYRSLRESGIRKSISEFLREHSRWILTKKDLDFVNVLLDAAGVDQVGYEWLDKRENYVLPFSSEENCWPTDRYFLQKYIGVRDELNKKGVPDELNKKGVSAELNKKRVPDELNKNKNKKRVRDELNKKKVKQPADHDDKQSADYEDNELIGYDEEPSTNVSPESTDNDFLYY